MIKISDTEYFSNVGTIRFLNMDCNEFMKGLKENEFDFNLSDPPYGIGFGKFNRTNKATDGTRIKANKYKNDDWDSFVPSDEMFEVIKHTSNNQIIFGGNYFKILAAIESPNLKTIEQFNDYIQNSKENWLFWYKQNPVPNFADGELAWLSENLHSSQIDFRYYGNLEGNSSTVEKIHPTQKPVDLYRIILCKYTTPAATILDCFGGSMSNAIACHMERRNLTIIEFDVDYFKSALKRFDMYERQLTLF